MDIERRISFLQSVSIFSETPLALLTTIAENLEEVEVSAGDHIVLKGDMGDSMYFIVDGRAKVHDGDYIFSVLKKGDVFGKYYLLDRKERSATVTALSHTFILRFHQEVFFRLTRNENTIIKGLLRALVGRLRDMNVAEEQLAQQNYEIVRQKEELQRQKEELEIRKNELIDLNATKDKFFSIIAHDLRSPITTLISLSEVLRTEMDLMTLEQQQEVLNSVYDLSKNNLKLLDNLLQWAKMQTGQLVAHKEQFRIMEVIQEVARFFAAYARDKEIILEVQPSDEIVVVADQNMIRTILRNLVSNAIKYTAPAGLVSIGCSASHDMCTVAVRDNGLGMTPETQSRLFRLDQAASARGTANERGTGLGLLLCKEFVEKNGGQVSVESQRGFGSEFRFTLPVKPD
jgi:signal transduction histidine kinase